MSNRRKCRLGRVTSERCSFCGRAAGGPRALRLKTGQVACPRCQEYGQWERLDCGHLSLPGAKIMRNVGGTGESRCLRCAGEG